MSGHVLDVQVLAGRERLAELETPWWELFARADTATPFQSPAWLLPWAECFARDGAVWTITVTSGRRLVALLPLVLTTEAGKVTARALGHGMSDYLDALVDPAERAEVPAALSHGMRRLARDVDAFELSDLPGDSAVLDIQGTLAMRSTAPCAVCPRVRLGGSFSKHLATVPRWLCRNYRQGEARLARAGATHALADESSLGHALESFFELHGARWRARGERGVLADPGIREFHRRAAPRLLARGLLELHTSCVGDRPIACAYVLVRRHAHLYLTGFDPAYDRCSAGSVVIGRTIARAIDAGRRYYDFLRGPEPYKYAWGATDIMTTRLAFAFTERASPSECVA